MSFFKFRNKKFQQTIEWVKDHSYGITSLEDCQIDDFHFLEEFIKDKRVVFLGENGHGVGEHSLLKTKLIEFLYHKMGYKIVAFESGFSEAVSANFLKNELSVIELMDKSVFSLWKSEETFPLFELIQRADLNLTGFDFQPSVKEDFVLDFLNQLPIPLPSDFKGIIEETGEMLMSWYQKIGIYKASNQKVPNDVEDEFIKSQKEIKQQLNHLIKQLNDMEELFQNSLDTFKVLQKLLENKQHFLTYIGLPRKDAINFRDRIMAYNLEWICSELYPDEKIIVWANNAHIFKNIKGTSGYKPMGSLISDELAKQSYFMGLFMYEGKATLNKGTVYDLSKPPKKSLEDYMNQNHTPVSFLDFSKAVPAHSNKWLYQNTIYMKSGTMPNYIVPAEQLDGVFFVKKVAPPHYL